MGGRTHDVECEVCGCWWGGIGWDYDKFPKCPCDHSVSCDGADYKGPALHFCRCDKGPHSDVPS